MASSLANRGGLGGKDPRSAWGEDVLAQARKTIVDLMMGENIKRYASIRLKAAAIILNRDFLAVLPDEELIAEYKRRLNKDAKSDAS